MARGEFLAFLDDDDIWTKEHLSALLSVYRKNRKIMLIQSDCHQFRDGEDGLELLHASCNPSPWPVGSVLAHYASLKPWPFLSSSCFSIRREAYLEIGGYSTAFRRLEDVDILLRANTRWSIHCTQKITVYYRLTSEVSSSKFWEVIQLELIELCRMYHIERSLPGRLKIVLQRKTLWELDQAQRTGDRSRIFTVFVRYLKNGFSTIHPDTLLRILATLLCPPMIQIFFRHWQKKLAAKRLALPDCLARLSSIEEP
jgi:hypothetical protein